MSDLIDRLNAIDVLEILADKMSDEGKTVMAQAVAVLKDLQSAEPERKKGKWIEISWSEPDQNVCCTSYAFQSAKCSICGKYHTTPYLYSLDYFPYCPHCGADMRGEDGKA